MRWVLEKRHVVVPQMELFIFRMISVPLCWYHSDQQWCTLLSWSHIRTAESTNQTEQLQARI